jgi:hypothetical protein
VVCSRAECFSETSNDEPVYAIYARTFLKFCVAARVWSGISTSSIGTVRVTEWHSFDRCGLMLV